MLPLKAEEQSQIGLKNADSKFQMVDLFTGDDGQKVMTIPHMTHDPLGQRATNIRQQQTIIINKMNCELKLTYDTPALWQTGSRNLMGPKTLPTIWGTYMMLVTKYQISAINSY